MWLVIVLLIVNIPVYLFIAWLAFDSRQGAALTFGDTLVNILKIILIPKIVRVLLDIDTSGAIGILPILGYFIACAAVTYGEWWLLMKLFWPGQLAQVF